MGLEWHRAVERIRDGWSNPYGGLLTFGHALGASGLVQVNKTQHIFSGDRRHLRPIPSGPGPIPGTLAFTTSVGGPLSHIVVSLFRGGDGELPQPGRTSPSAAWVERRRKLRCALPVHLARVERTFAGRGRPMLVEGATYVSIRSCLRALKPADIARLTFDGIEALLRPEHLEEVRLRLRSLVSLVVTEAERLSSLFDVFRVLTDELVAMGEEWREADWFSAGGGGHAAGEAHRASQGGHAGAARRALRREQGRVRRVVQFLPRSGLGYEALEGVDLLDRARRGASAARRTGRGAAPSVVECPRAATARGAGAGGDRERTASRPFSAPAENRSTRCPADLILLRGVGAPRAAAVGDRAGGARPGRVRCSGRRPTWHRWSRRRRTGWRRRRRRWPRQRARRRAGSGVAGCVRPGGEPAVDDRRVGGATDATDLLRFAREVARATAVSGVRVRRRWRPARGCCSTMCSAGRRWRRT